MSVVRVRFKILGGRCGWNQRWEGSRFRRVHLIKLFLMNQGPHSGPGNLCKSYLGLIHNDIIYNNKKDNKISAFSFSEALLPTYYVPDSRVCEDSFNFKGAFI